MKDPQTADDLISQGHPIGAKRICTDSGYFDALNRPKVDLVSLRRTLITEFTETGIKTEEGLREFDVIIYATGFVLKMDIKGPRSNKMSETCADRPVRLLGLQVPGFPNFFNISGPG